MLCKLHVLGVVQVIYCGVDWSLIHFKWIKRPTLFFFVKAPSKSKLPSQTYAYFLGSLKLQCLFGSLPTYHFPFCAPSGKVRWNEVLVQGV